MTSAARGRASPVRAIVMVWDGLRPDMVSEQTTPRLHALAAAGVRFAASHAIFPTVTRCNAASIATGAQPAGHGIPGNEFVIPGSDGEVLTAANAAHLDRLRAARGGRLLRRPTLSELVSRAGGSAAVVGTGSPGASLLHHPDAAALGGRVYNQALWVGTSRAEMEAARGPMPAGALPNTEQNAYFTRLITEGLLDEPAPQLITYWHTDPDRTQHVRGVGHPDTMRSVRDADDGLGAILDALDRRGLAGSTNVVVTSDHGFSTMGEYLDIPDALVAAGVKASRESTDVVVASNAVYVREGGPELVARVVAALQALPGIGCLFTGANGTPVVPGTVPLPAIGHDGELEPEVLFSPEWSDEANEHGYPGTRPADGSRYAADHGALSPWEVRNTLIAAGPAFKRGLVSDVPAGNADVAPTLAHALGIAAPGPFDGRVLAEALAGGPDPARASVVRTTLDASHGRYAQRVQVAEVDGARYVALGVARR